MSPLGAGTIQFHEHCGQATGLPQPPSSQGETFVEAGMGFLHHSRESPEGAELKGASIGAILSSQPVNPQSCHSAFLSPTSTTLIQTARDFNLPLKGLGKHDFDDLNLEFISVPGHRLTLLPISQNGTFCW